MKKTILALYQNGGNHMYAGEPVTQLEHAWQCGRLAEKSAKSKIRHFVLVSSMGATHRDHPLNRMYSNILTWKL